MAGSNKRRKENVPGNFFVDSSCIDCGTCYWMAPQFYRRESDQSIIYQQPIGHEEEVTALQALLSCPTHSIGTENRFSILKEITTNFPLPIADNVFHCGFHAQSSFGASSYFIQHPQGNILVDSPRFTKPLVDQFKQMGGIQYQYLTHQDDVADTDLYQREFSSQRIIHRDDVTVKTRHYEIIIQGEKDFFLGHSNSQSHNSQSQQVQIISVPGHTKGHTVLLLNKRFLFTGDHLAWSPQLSQLIAFRTACWYDWKVQIESMKKLFSYSFTHVLPGHGHPYTCENSEEMQKQLKKCVTWMENKSD